MCDSQDLNCSILEGLKSFRLCDSFKTSLKTWPSHNVSPQYNLTVLVSDSDLNLAAALSDLSQVLYCILVCSPEGLRALHPSCGCCNEE